MKDRIAKIKNFCTENPKEAIVITALSLTAIAKVVDTTNAHRNSRTWKKEVDRRATKNA